MKYFSRFIFDDSLVVRALERDGDPWFAAVDIARALQYSDPDQAIQKNCKKVEVSATRGADQIENPLVIPESDVYRLIMRSNSSEAERFQDWICEEVVPSIRKGGSYFLAEGAEQAMLLRETEETMARLRERRDAMNLELRRLEKRRRRLGGEVFLPPSYAPSPKLTPEDILEMIPAEGIRVRALERIVCERFECVRTTFYRHWKTIRERDLVAVREDLVFRAA